MSTFTPSRARSYLALACGLGVAVATGVHAVAPAMPVIQAHLGLSQQDVGLFTAVYMFPGVVMAVPLGMLVDVVGRRRVFCAMGLVFGLAGLAQGFTGHFPTMLALRALQGTGFAALMPLSITLIGDAYRGIDQVRAQATRHVSMGSADFALPVIGTALAGIAWNAPLLFQGAILPLVIAGWFVLDDAVTTGMNRAYLGNVRRSVRQPGMKPLLFSGFIRFFFKFGVVTYLPLLLVGTRGLPITRVGFIVGTASGMSAVAGTQVPRLLRHARPSVWMVASMGVLTVALAAFAVVPNFSSALAVAVVYGMADGTFGVLQSGYLTQAVPATVRAGVVSLSGMIRNLGKFLAPLALAALVAVAPLAIGFLLLAAIALLFTPAMFWMRGLDAVFDVPPPQKHAVRSIDDRRGA